MPCLLFYVSIYALAYPCLWYSFNSSCFLCCSVASFGVSTISLKNSLFNMSSVSAIVFIKCWNCQHMKNNISYKGNTNNTSVIIFLNRALVLFWWLSLLLKRQSYPKESKTPDVIVMVGLVSWPGLLLDFWLTVCHSQWHPHP